MKEGQGTKEADKAIIDASQGKIDVHKMLIRVIAAQVFVPLKTPIEMDGEKMKSWQPVTVSNPDRGDYLLAFTNEDSKNNFIKKNTSYKFGIILDTEFLITILPPEHGILFNINGESCFEWGRKGILTYHQAISLKKK